MRYSVCLSSVQSLSRVQLFVTPWTAACQGLPVKHQCPEPTQTHVYWVGDAIQPSHSVIPFSSHPQSLLASGSFQMSQLFVSKYWSFSFNIILPVNTQDWSPLGWTGWISLQSKGLSRIFSNTKFKSINSSALSFLHSPTLTSIHDHWKNHSFG